MLFNNLIISKGASLGPEVVMGPHLAAPCRRLHVRDLAARPGE